MTGSYSTVDRETSELNTDKFFTAKLTLDHPREILDQDIHVMGCKDLYQSRVGLITLHPEFNRGEYS